ncbi:M12 family metallo-peptidase [Hyphobacterium sp. HN65]|uniref:M12 family metallo-peptidase n=1 Tax=Hyphobacterium lacteum TaxID=3116575 RepID=A0ABU7LQ66_9PROT|nr:M12 family metallo-peptidase [Hyphobacterium sp. HN65]MEE2526033.1 M12 family metallo-peptidase [Hyphobacterium sp. HN65]
MFKWAISALAVLVFSASALAQNALLTREGDDGPGYTGLSASALDAVPGDTVTLTLPDGEYAVAFDRSGEENGTRVWVGHLAEAGEPYRLILTEGPGAAFAYLATPNGAWRLAPAAAGQASIWQRDHGAPLEPDTDYLSPVLTDRELPDISLDETAIARAVATGSNGTIDIAIVYTDGMRSFYGMGLMTRLQHLVNVLDQALIDSDTGLRARFAGATPVPGVWTETTSTLESIDDLFAGASFGHPGSEPDVNGGECSNGPGGCINNGDLSSLLEWRNALGADVVVMLRRYWRAQQTYCGVAYVPGFGAEEVITPEEDWVLGIAVTGDGPDGNGTAANCGDLTFAHEVGHNLGSTHNVENTSSPAVFLYSYGHRIDCSIRTIMAYDSRRSGVNCNTTNYANEAWVPRFSNPGHSDCFGQTCGAPHLAGSPGDDTTTPTDNARSIRTAGFNVRDYRPEGMPVVSAILPYSRTVAQGTPATAFLAIINPASSGSVAEDCGLELHGASPGQFVFRPTDPATNLPSAPEGTRVDIPAGGLQTFVFSLTRPSAEAFSDLRIDTVCANRAPAPSHAGVNTFRFSSTSLSLPDIVALAATMGNNGIVELPAGGGAGAFSVASINLRSLGTVNVTPQASAGTPSLELLDICRTNAVTGECETGRAASISLTMGTDSTATFAVFVQSSGDIANDPAANRIFVNFTTPGGTYVGATSVAVRTAAQ